MVYRLYDYAGVCGGELVIMTNIDKATRRGKLIRRATIAQKRRGKMAKEKVRETANKAREAQG